MIYLVNFYISVAGNTYHIYLGEGFYTFLIPVISRLAISMNLTFGKIREI